MDYLFLLDQNPDTTLHTQEAAPAHLFSSAEAAHLLTVPDPATTLLSADADAFLFDAGTRDLGGSTGGDSSIWKILFTNAGDVLLLNDGRIATGRR